MIAVLSPIPSADCRGGAVLSVAGVSLLTC
jgi:hypothetical protein